MDSSGKKWFASLSFLIYNVRRATESLFYPYSSQWGFKLNWELGSLGSVHSLWTQHHWRRCIINITLSLMLIMSHRGEGCLVFFFVFFGEFHVLFWKVTLLSFQVTSFPSSCVSFWSAFCCSFCKYRVDNFYSLTPSSSECFCLLNFIVQVLRSE